MDLDTMGPFVVAGAIIEGIVCAIIVTVVVWIFQKL